MHAKANGTAPIGGAIGHQLDCALVSLFRPIDFRLAGYWLRPL